VTIRVDEEERPRGRRPLVFERRAELLLAHLAERTDESEGMVIGRALSAYRRLVRQRDNGSPVAVERKVMVEVRLPFIGCIWIVRCRELHEVAADGWLTAREEDAAP
jgi:hypothetical protein